MSTEQSLLFMGERQHEACGCGAPGRFRLGSAERKYERSRPFEVRHLELDLDLNFKDKSISGAATLEFSRRAIQGRELHLDGHGFEVEAVSLSCDGSDESAELSPEEYVYDGDRFSIPIAPEVKTGSVTIRYRARPRLGLYFLEPDAKVPDRPKQVWSQCQDEDGKHWFPCQDKPHVKMSYGITARVPKGMQVLSGGRLVEKKTPSRGTWSFTHRLDEPTPAYLVTLVAGQFEEWMENLKLPSGKVVALRYLVPPGRMADGKRAFSSTARAVELFGEKTGVEYPYDSYTQVVVADFIFGGMENTTATTMYEHILLDKTATLDVESNDLVAHELAHHWFGDLVTCRDWSHAWLNEGFATYFEHVEREARTDVDEYEHHVTVDLNIYLGEASSYKRPIVCRDYEEPIDLFDRHLYQKGGLILHMLRRRLGDEAFFSGIHRYLIQNRGGLVETNDLMRSLEDTSGISLERFFDEWVYRPGHPSLKVGISYADGLLIVDVEQTQSGEDVATFELPFSVDVRCNGQVERHSRIITDKKSSLVVQLQQRPDWIAIDPEYQITAPFTLNAPADLLRNLLKEGPRARARRMAALALSRRSDPPTITALEATLTNSGERWMVRAKAAESLAKIGGDECESHLIAASRIEDPKVRRAVAEALGQFSSEECVTTLLGLSRDESYLVSAAAARSLGKTKSARAHKPLLKLLDRNSWSDVIRSGALQALSHRHDDATVQLLLEWTKYGKPLRVRRVALSSLGQVGSGRAVRLHLEDLLKDRDPHIRAAVLGALERIGDSEARGAISRLLEGELDGGVRTQAKEVLKHLGGTARPAITELRDENSKLRQEMNRLSTRLAKLEQAVKSKPSMSSSASSEGRPSQKKGSPARQPTSSAPRRGKTSGNKRTSRTGRTKK